MKLRWNPKDVYGWGETPAGRNRGRLTRRRDGVHDELHALLRARRFFDADDDDDYYDDDDSNNDCDAAKKKWTSLDMLTEDATTSGPMINH